MIELDIVLLCKGDTDPHDQWLQNYRASEQTDSNLHNNYQFLCFPLFYSWRGLGRVSTSRTIYKAHKSSEWGMKTDQPAVWNLAQNRLLRQSRSWGAPFPIPYIYSWEDQVPDSPENRNTSHDRLQGLEMQGHTHVPYAKVIWNTQGHWLTCLYIAGGRYRIFQNDLKSQKKIPRHVIVFGWPWISGKDVYPGLNWLKKGAKEEKCTQPDTGKEVTLTESKHWHKAMIHGSWSRALTSLLNGLAKSPKVW